MTCSKRPISCYWPVDEQKNSLLNTAEIFLWPYIVGSKERAMTHLRIIIRISGLVQGVGFRPFIYTLAKKYHLGGWVQNDAKGVQIEVEGESDLLDQFVADVKFKAPPMAVIGKIIITTKSPCGGTSFEIKSSLAVTNESTLILPDLATCLDCQREIADPANRRHDYAFTNCTHCGPRYSIIMDVPYDRINTTMADFSLCPTCQQEYRNATNRRFHAQPNACATCGPAYRLINKSGQQLTGNPLLRARQLINKGAIVAVKGVGGYHLICNARDDKAVTLLRTRKHRQAKPFAVMCGSLETARCHCQISSDEEHLLTDRIASIVLLAKGPAYCLSQAVAPNNPYLGVLLPYTAAHWILLSPDDIWVMTSGNRSNEPIAYEDNTAIHNLSDIADYFLTHNRRIYSPTDDSVTLILKNKPYILRRSRGLVPAPIRLSRSGPAILACGGEAKNTFCLTKGALAFMSAHIGDLENRTTFEAYGQAIERYQRLFKIKPETVACDLHPDYLSTKYAQTLNLPCITVQHHHAHIAGVLAEHGLNEPVIGIAFDGTGYGTDGRLWGGEFLLADCREFTRLAHCSYLTLPGGSKAIQEPWRPAAWLLHQLYGPEFINKNIPLVHCLPKGWQLAMQATSLGINAPQTSSCGRLFDIAAAILGIQTQNHYEGQAAIELEFAASKAVGFQLPYIITENAVAELDFTTTFAAMVEELERGCRPAVLAAAFHETLAVACMDMTRRLSRRTGIHKIALSGGVFQNVTFLQRVVPLLEKEFTVLLHRQIPPNDGGLALGQAIVAIERSR
jgi:hydrogenase maturation protein HypF